jgi:hypothetical protein
MLRAVTPRHRTQLLGVLSLLALLWGPGRAPAQTTYRTLAWSAPTSTPTLPGGERLVYSLWRRGAHQNYYQWVRTIPLTGLTYPVAVPQGVDYICYRVGVVRVPIAGLAVVDTSPWADVEGFPGCYALCLRGSAPYRALLPDECAPP